MTRRLRRREISIIFRKRWVGQGISEYMVVEYTVRMSVLLQSEKPSIWLFAGVVVFARVEMLKADIR